MRISRLIMTAVASGIIWTTFSVAWGQNTADATLELNITLSDVRITDTLTGNSRSAVFENTLNGVGDIVFEDMGPNGAVHSGGSPNNPPASVGSGSSSEIVSLNGLDPFVDDIDMDSFDIGDSLSTTMFASATATTPGAVFFGQVNSHNVLYFSAYGADTDQFTFFFDYSARLSGALSNVIVPGATLAFGDGDAVDALADSTVSGIPNSFNAASDYFSLGAYRDSGGLMPLDQATSGSFTVTFAPGDNAFQISFLSSLLVNAGVTAVPESSAIAMLLVAGVVAAGFGYRSRR